MQIRQMREQGRSFCLSERDKWHFAINIPILFRESMDVGEAVARQNLDDSPGHRVRTEQFGSHSLERACKVVGSSRCGRDWTGVIRRAEVGKASPE